jgi:hypothetical protein
MRSYINSKPPSKVDPKWIFLSASQLKSIKPDLDEIAALLFISRKKEVGIIYKPTPNC